ncbi:hypothetical protein [Acidithiobacillus ferrooxidans]|uniref:hypothetical protein n=1 Tax=Acidithiobacillus ferrooxidans TaxID=920 RepID=UPI000AB1F1D6|nr:hypothetical protein [Acidithiobacillus ferrooxidans]MCR1343368.1 hypothetical protein [Acidithiobacillus ferrooxidans]
MSKSTSNAINYFLIFSITPLVALIVYISFQALGININLMYVLYMLLLILFIKIILAGAIIGISKITGFPLLKDRWHHPCLKDEDSLSADNGTRWSLLPVVIATGNIE